MEFIIDAFLIIGALLVGYFAAWWLDKNGKVRKK